MKNICKIIFFVLIYSLNTEAQPVTWQKYYDYSSREDFGNDVIQTYDGGYIIAGMGTSKILERDILLIKINCLGNVEWKKLIGESMAFERAFKIKQSSDSGFIITGDANYTMILLKTDKNGNTLWRKDFTESNANGQGNSLKGARLNHKSPRFGWIAAMNAGSLQDNKA